MSKEDVESYERGIAKLIEIVAHAHEAARDGWTPTPLRKEIEEIAKRLDEVADLLGHGGSAHFRIERVHDEDEDLEIGLDGYPIESEPGETNRGAYQATKWRIRRLAESAREAVQRLPDPRQKHALPFAARGLLHLRHDHGYPPPTLSNDSDDVKELDRVCRAANICLSPARLRGALTKALILPMGSAPTPRPIRKGSKWRCQVA